MIYVGKRSSKKHPDIDTYFGSGVHIYRAIKKYGKENFKKEIITIVDTAEAAEELEELIVDADFIARKDTYNMIVGGQKGSRGLKHTEETKRNMSERNIGKQLTDEHKSKISESNKGKQFSNVTKSRLSDAHKGKKFSDKTKAKMAESKNGRVWINNGKISKCVKPAEIERYIAAGFIIGRISSPS